MIREEAIEYGTEWLKDEYLDAKDREFIKITIEALKQEPCTDCISRKAVLDIINFEDKWLLDAKGHNTDTEIAFSGMKFKVSDLPSVHPKPKTGHWIRHEEQFNALGIAVKGGVKCSECGYTTHNKLHMEFGCPYNYCPNCGCAMIKPQAESEG